MSLPDDASPRLTDIDWRWALPRIAVVFIVTRLLVLAVAVAVEVTQPAPPEGIRVDERPLIASLTVWEGTYYVGVAEDGYHADPAYGPDYAFYPGYPLVVRATSVLTLGDMSIAAIVATNAAFLLALVALFALSVRRLEPGRAILSLWFFSLAPGAIAYSISYSDSQFALFAICAFLAMETRHPWLSGLSLALATLTRAPGILLGLPLLLMVVEQHGARPSRVWLPLFIAPVALLAYLAYLWWLTGDPMAPMSAQAYWDLGSDVNQAVASGATVPDAARSLTGVVGQAPAWVMAIWIGALAFYTFLFVYFRKDRMRPAYWLVAIISVASVFLAGRLQSTPRYLAVAWPFDWVLAGRESRLGRATVLGVFALLHVVLLWLALTWRLAP